MKRLLILILLVFVGVAGWRVGTLLSSDALGMVVGLLLGVLASVPTALLVMAAQRDGRGRRQEEDADRSVMGRGGHPNYMQGYGPQPPVIVLTQGAPTQPGIGYDPQRALPGPGYGPGPEAMPARDRRFKVVGEKESWLDEW